MHQFIVIVLTAFLLPSQAFSKIDKFTDRNIHVSLGSEIQSVSLGLINSDTARDIQYGPNLAGLLVPRLAYKDLFTISWAFQLPLSDLEKQLQGETQYTDSRFTFDLGSFRLNVFYLQYRGFFVENTGNVDPSIIPPQKLIRPDLYFRSYGAEFTWIKNPERFSLKALSSQAERINGSGGSLLLGASYNNNRIEDDTGVFPNVVKADYGDEAELAIADLSTVSAKIGYGYGTGKKWFAGGAIQGGPGIGQQNLIMNDGQSRQGTIATLRVEVLLSLGYNGDQFFSSIQSELKQDYFYLKDSNTQITNDLSNVVFNVGVHLDSLGL